MSPKLQRQLDNQTFHAKAALRRRALAQLAAWGVAPVVCECYGGTGALWSAVYADVRQGVVFEHDSRKVDTLAKQRISWSVYEADCVVALTEGAGSHLEVTLLDIDPYGLCLPALEAFMTSERPFAPRMVVVTNDGARQAAQVGIGWQIGALKPYVEKYGNDLYPIYRTVLDEAIRDTCAKAGYTTTMQVSFESGKNGAMVQGMHVLERRGEGGSQAPPIE